MGDSCKQPDYSVVPEAAGIRGVETLATLRLLSRGFGTLASLLRFVSTTLFNLRVLADAAPFVTDQSTKRPSISPDAATEIFDNAKGSYTSVFIQAESYIDGTGAAVPCTLAVDTEKDNCTYAKARRKVTGNFPSLTLWVPPNTKLYARLTDGSGANQTKYVVTVTPVPLRGTGAYFGTGDV